MKVINTYIENEDLYHMHIDDDFIIDELQREIHGTVIDYWYSGNVIETTNSISDIMQNGGYYSEESTYVFPVEVTIEENYKDDNEYYNNKIYKIKNKYNLK